MGYHLRVKICGVTTDVDARIAASLGADAVGLNFAAESPRRIDKQTAQGILRALPPFVEAVGVFVSKPLKQIYQELSPLGRALARPVGVSGARDSRLEATLACSPSVSSPPSICGNTPGTA